ncbi:hypothetical protein SALBM217S_08278 [Streptomyces griseoloalbus]
MRIRAFTPQDLTALTDLTIETFRPFYEDSFRPLVGEAVFANQHGDWRDDYRRQVPTPRPRAAPVRRGRRGRGRRRRYRRVCGVERRPGPP